MPALAVQMTLSGEASTFDAAAQGSFKTQQRVHPMDRANREEA